MGKWIKVLGRKEEGLEFRPLATMGRLGECGSLTVVPSFAKQREALAESSGSN